MDEKPKRKKDWRKYYKPHPRKKKVEVTCAHHYIIETPSGSTSDARCKLCGKARSFYNSFDALVEKQNKGRSPWRGYHRGRIPRPSKPEIPAGFHEVELTAQGEVEVAQEFAAVRDVGL